MHNPAAFSAALQSFFEGCQRVSETYRAKHCPNVPPSVWKLETLSVRIRVTRDGSAHCFVDIPSGDVLKPASWKAPAKHPRGNIHDEHNGLKDMGPYGPAYLRGGR